MMKRFVPAPLAVLLLLARPAAQAPTLESLLAAATGYVGRYFEVMPNVTAEEHYVQDLVPVRPVVFPNGSVSDYLVKKKHDRDLRSDVSLINVGPPVEWRTYRDVYLVDERPVRDRTDRLARLMRQPAGSARIQADRIADESARFNISRFGRVLNEPGLPLVFLQPALQSKFQFTLDKKDGRQWIVRYQEQGRPTLFKHNTTLDNPSAGRFWIQPQTGEITKTEMVLEPSGLHARFTTVFEHDNKYGVGVPTQLREELYSGVGPMAVRLEGEAEYRNYRRFSVETEESVR